MQPAGSGGLSPAHVRRADILQRVWCEFAQHKSCDQRAIFVEWIKQLLLRFSRKWIRDHMVREACILS
jgi:hypothetical protein